MVPNFFITDTYGYSPEDIVVLKDDPSLPEHLQPNRVNMVESSSHCPGVHFSRR